MSHYSAERKEAVMTADERMLGINRKYADPPLVVFKMLLLQHEKRP